MNSTLHTINQALAARLAMLESKHLRRERAPVVPPSLLDFSSNDYLGLAKQIAPYDLLSAANVGSAASRAVFQNSLRLDTLETDFARWTHWESTLFCSSGFVANMAIVESIASLEDVECFVDVRAHASIFVAMRAAGISPTHFRHRDYELLEKRLLESESQYKVVFVESLHSMDGTFEDADALTKICERTGSLLVVDEAHSIGIVGERGSGWVSSHPLLKKHTLAVMYGCGKAIGVSGGVIGATRLFIDNTLCVSKSFLYTTAPSPMIAATVSASVKAIQSDIGEAQRKNLVENILCLVKLGTEIPGFCATPGSPIAYVFLSDEKSALDASHMLKDLGIVARPMRPPTVPRGTSRLRIIVRAEHNKEDLETLKQGLQKVVGSR